MKCGPLALRGILGNLISQFGSEEFNSALDNPIRGGEGDIEEIAQGEARRCGMDLSTEGNTVHATSPAAAVN